MGVAGGLASVMQYFFCEAHHRYRIQVVFAIKIVCFSVQIPPPKCKKNELTCMLYNNVEFTITMDLTGVTPV